jgi:hypothetical protein
MNFRSASSLLVAVATLASVAASGTLDDVQGPWGEILAANVKGDRVDYAGILKEKAKFEGYLKSLAALDSNAVNAASKEERSALYINAYNAAVFQLILKNPSKGSVAQMPGDITGAKVVMVAQESLAVADIARKKLLDVNSDPRFWSLMCDGSLGAAPILNQAVTSANLESLSEERTKFWLADTSRNKIDSKQSKLAQIPFDFFRFKPEFKGYAGGMHGFVVKYAPAGADLDKNRPTFFYNGAKNSIVAAAPVKGKKAKKGKK